MKNFIVLLVAAIAFTNAEPLIDGLTALLPNNALGGGFLGGGGATNIIGEGNGVTGGLLDDAGILLDVGGILGLRNTKCLKKCPLPVADVTLTCIKATTFPGYPICYGQNTNMKHLWPCQENNLPSPADEEDE